MSVMKDPTRTQITRRHLLQMVGAGAATAALAGCVGPGSVKPASSAAATDAFSGKAAGTVNFYHYRGQDKDAFSALIQRFEKKYPAITVTQTITTSTDYNANALQKVKAGGVGDALPALRGPQFASFVQAGVFTSLEGQPIVDNYDKALLLAGANKGTQWGLPYQILLLQPLLNEDLFDKAGAELQPTTWDGFLNVCEKLKSKGITPIAFPGGDVGNNPQIFSSMVLADEPSVDACAGFDTGKQKVTDDWFIQVLKKYQTLGQYFQPNFMGTSLNSADQIFASGQSGMLSTGSYDIATTRTLGGKFPINTIFPVTLAKANPDWYKGVYNATFILGVNSQSSVKPAALQWLEFLSETENASYYANTTAQWTTVKGVTYENPDLKKLSPLFKEKLSLGARYQILNSNIATAVYASCTNAAQGMNVEQAAENAQKIIDQALTQ
ncbi:extracellular solute-binding protein [Humibacter soli]